MNSQIERLHQGRHLPSRVVVGLPAGYLLDELVSWLG